MQSHSEANSASVHATPPPASPARGQGSHRVLFAQACARHPGNPQAQFAAYLADAVLPAAIGRRRQVSDKTRTDFGDTLKAVPRLLRRLRRPLQNASEFGRSHVIALVRHWEQRGHAEATVQWRVSLLRRFFTLVGKPQVLPAGAAWHAILHAQGITAGTRRRSQVATEPKAWSARGIDALALIDAIRLQHPVVASQLDLSLHFGLRKNEALQIRPREADLGTRLLVVDGTKGGKPRAVHFSSEPSTAQAQRQVLERAKTCAALHPRGILAIPGLSLQQSRDHANYVLRKFGITRKRLGVTQHGLRHQFGCDAYADGTGLPAPVLAAAPAAAYRREPVRVRAVEQGISRQLGHERSSITAAYTGSLPVLERGARARLRGWHEACAGFAAAWAELQVLQVWTIGAGASGLPPSGDAPLYLLVHTSPTAPAPFAARDEALQRLRTPLAAALAAPVRLLPLLPGDSPGDDAVQLYP